MTSFVSPAGWGTTLICADDQRLKDPNFAQNDSSSSYPIASILLPNLDPLGVGLSFQWDWWPNSGAILGTMDGSGTLDLLMPSAHWEDILSVPSGCNGRLGFVGYTRNAYGSVVAGCTVKLFRVSDDSLQASVYSDGNGLYFATTPYSDNHYIVVFAPSGESGSTVNTLTPS